MSPRSTVETEVCVIGAGPAGAVCAKRLAELGHQVLVVERYCFPRPHVGEALTPACWPLLEVLGVRPAVQAAGFRPATESLVRWRDERAEVVRLPAGVAGLTVDRGRFDRILLDAAVSAGARVLQPATARRARRTSAGWEVPLRSAGGDATVRARFLVDASGRGFALGGRKEPTAPRTIALHGLWHGARRPGPPTRVLAERDAWFWGTLRPDGSFRAMVFMDPRMLRRFGVGRAGLDGCYRGLLHGSALLDGLADARQAGPVSVCDATAFADPEPVGEDSIKIGEAAFALDPLSSSGVDKAMQTAMAASVTVHTLLAAGHDRQAAMDFYRDSQRRSVEQHAQWAAGHYAEHRIHRDRPFWLHRGPLRQESTPAKGRASKGGASAPDPVPPGPTVPDPWVRLAPTAALVDTPCAVGDRVELRRALSHPGLPRPVAFVDGVALAPLLDAIGSGRRLDDLLVSWGKELPTRRASELADWLHRQGALTIDHPPDDRPPDDQPTQDGRPPDPRPLGRPTASKLTSAGVLPAHRPR
ncbi:NAD(P)/FAD-dependent oxidoreductase [Kitasatospora sp. NPDC048540]|uniref:flavin-dependent monooxygenase QhpG n=1 Tax=Kitasatospora sp. NPDC048540 TaxID=3155634 RepID=UPI0033D52031